MNTYIYVTARFVSFHRWAAAPNQTAFLREWHRHLFHVKLTVQVGHGDRQVEFFDLQKKLVVYLEGSWKEKKFEQSCEQIATKILEEFKGRGYDVAICEVSEDGENGAIVIVPPTTPVARDILPDEDRPTTTSSSAKVVHVLDPQTGKVGYTEEVPAPPTVCPPPLTPGYYKMDVSTGESVKVGEFDTSANHYVPPPNVQVQDLQDACSAQLPEGAKDMLDKIKEEVAKGDFKVKGDPLPDIVTKVRTKPFFGIEAEGPFQGERTIFIPGRCDFNLAVLAISKDVFARVYYGAGNDRDIKYNLLYKLMVMRGGCRVTVEIKSWESLTTAVQSELFEGEYEVVSMTPYPGNLIKELADKKRFWFKTVNETGIDWNPMHGGPVIHTNLNDDRFAKDFELPELG